MMIRNKLILGYLFVASLIIFVGYFGVKEIIVLEKEFNKVGRKTIPLIESLHKLKFTGLRIVSSTSEFGFIQAEKRVVQEANEKINRQADEAALKEEEILRREAKDKFRFKLKEYKEFIAKFSPENKESATFLAGGFQNLMKTSEEIISLKKQGVAGLEVLKLKERFEAEEMLFLNTIDRILIIENGNFLRNKRELKTTVSNSIITILSIGVSTFILAIILGTFISSYISNPITKMKELAFNIGKGNLDASIVSKSQDEIGQLALSFNEMASNLKKTTVSRNFVDNIIRSMLDTLVVVSPNGKIQMVNPSLCRLLNYEEEELLGKPVSMIFCEKKYLDGIETEALIKELSVSNSEKNYLTKNGQVAYMLFSGSVMVDEEGNTLGIVCVAQDMTAQKKAREQAKLHQQQLVQADKMASLGTLVAGVAHEINNPNNFVLVNAPIFSKIWKDTLPIIEEYYRENGDFSLGGFPYGELDKTAGKLLAGIADGSRRINEIVCKLKDFSRQDFSGHKIPVHINQVIEAAVELVRNQIEKSTEYFSMEFSPDLPEFRGSFQEMEQVIINLITNSCQALVSTSKKITVHTSYDKESGNLVATIMDEGVGIPPEYLPKITDPFFSTRFEQGGTGLGLSVSYKIVKDHGGNLSFTSEPKKGTTATITLPTV